MLAKLAAKIKEDLPQRENDEVFQKALIDIRDSPEVEEIAAQFGGKLPFTEDHVAGARPGAEAERALALIMHGTAFAMADRHCQPLSAKEITAKREELERKRDQALSLTPYDQHENRKRDLYVERINFALAFLLTPLNHPIVERRSRTRKEINGAAAADYDHARAVRASVQQLTRRIFGKAGDRVADVFVYAVTGISFSRDDGRRRFKR
jgi:hypothetical protein